MQASHDGCDNTSHRTTAGLHIVHLTLYGTQVNHSRFKVAGSKGMVTKVKLNRARASHTSCVRKFASRVDRKLTQLGVRIILPLGMTIPLGLLKKCL